MKKISSCLAASVLTALAVSAGTARAAALPKVHRNVSSGAQRSAVPQATANADGIGINLDVVGRIPGATLFRTAIDIANNTNTAVEVDVFLDASGLDSEKSFSITENGIVPVGTGLMPDHFVFHSDDLIDDMRAAGLISQTQENGTILGSLFVIFDNPAGTDLFTQVGQGSVQARFYSSNFGGTIGVSANGHELTTTEPVSIVGIARDTIGEPNTPQVTTNFFINNEGYALQDGTLIHNPVTVKMSGFSNATGLPLPHTFTFPIDEFQTAVIGNVYSTLGANRATDGDSIIVFFDIVTGNSAISGLSSTNDAGTKDPSAAQLRPADWTSGR